MNNLTDIIERRPTRKPRKPHKPHDRSALTLSNIASNKSLLEHYKRKGSAYPGENICSRVRWRIFMRWLANSRYYNAFGIDTQRVAAGGAI